VKRLSDDPPPAAAPPRRNKKIVDEMVGKVVRQRHILGRCLLKRITSAGDIWLTWEAAENPKGRGRVRRGDRTIHRDVCRHCPDFEGEALREIAETYSDAASDIEGAIGNLQEE